jgi:uncharacterized repeat protein (TIGR01451 family)
LKLKNKGPSDSSNMTIEDELPPEVNFVSVTQSQGTCSVDETGPTTITCHPGTIPPNGVATVTITVFVPSSTDENIDIFNEACVLGMFGDTNPTNDCSTAASHVEHEADLELTKDAPPEIVAGETLTYTLELINHGPSDAQQAIFGDSLPAGVIFVSATPSRASSTCEYVGHSVICDIGYLAKDDSVTVEIVVRVPSTMQDGNILFNSACITECHHDPNLDNDCDTTETRVIARGRLVGNVFEDHAGDTFRNSGDQGLEGWTVYLDDNDNGVFDFGERWDVSDSTGNYVFTGLGKDTYRVREVLQPGWIQTTADPADVAVSGQEDTFTGGDFGNFELIDVSGRVFHDFDNSATKSPGEPGLGGWRVFIDDDHDGVFDSGERNTLSDPSGNYTFDDLGPGSYAIREEVKPGWVQTTPNPAPIQATSGSDVSNVDFGNRRQGTPAKITGGGSIDQSVRNFGFVINPKTQGGVTTYTGNLEFQDKALNVNLKASTITFINVESDRIHGSFAGTATISGVAGYHFFVELEDRAEPGALVDKFRIRIAGSGGFTYDSNTYATKGGLLDKGGNIQIHKPSNSLTAGSSQATIASSLDTDAHSLLTGVLVVAIRDQDGLGANQLARIEDAVHHLNDSLSPRGANVMIVEADSGIFAEAHLNISQNSVCGGMADGVLGCATDDGDITLIAGWDWFSGSDAGNIGSQQFDLQTIVTHELGHAAGLGHSSDSQSAMYAFLAAGQARRDLTSHDVALLEDLESEVQETWHSLTAVISGGIRRPIDPALVLLGELSHEQSRRGTAKNLTFNSDEDQRVLRTKTESNIDSRSNSRDVKGSIQREKAALNHVPAGRSNSRRGIQQVLPSDPGQSSLPADLDEWSFDQIIDSLAHDPHRVS